MRINFIGNYGVGYVGESADENHLTRELETIGHTVQRVPRDIWKAVVDGHINPDWDGRLPLEADVNILCKWHHFDKREYVDALRKISKAPVVYWTWDYMDWPNTGSWHRAICQAADLHLTNEGGRLEDIRKDGIIATYFPFDVSDGIYDRVYRQKKYDVTFFGSWVQKGDRIAYLTKLKDQIPIKIFSWNWEEWKGRGFDAEPAVYGKEFAEKVAESKIVIGFSVEPDCWGYWSNRVGKVLTVGGFLLYQYAPGMELSIGPGASYFSSIPEMLEKVDHYLIDDDGRETITEVGYKIGRRQFTSRKRMEQLSVLLERFLSKNRQN